MKAILLSAAEAISQFRRMGPERGNRSDGHVSSV
jgi:hypothetical protein